jgi:hypothetical protein
VSKTLQVTYFEYIGLLSFFNCLIRNSLQKEDALYFYVDASKGFTLWMPVFKVLGFDIKNLSFHLKDIKAKNGELVQERIRREDLFRFEQKIIDEHSSFFKKESDSHPRLKSFILRSLIDESQMERRSIHRFILLLEVISQNKDKNGFKEVTFVIRNRPWFNICKEFSKQYQLKLRKEGLKKLYFSYQHFPIFYYLFKYFATAYKKRIAPTSLVNNLFIEGRGDFNLSNDGYHSDYFWYLNSDFPSQNIFTKTQTEEEKVYLEKYNLSACEMEIDLKRISQIDSSVSLEVNFLHTEKPLVSHLNSRYLSIKNYWIGVFTKYNVKTYLTWNKYNASHMAIADAVESIGGVSAIWQLAFDGQRVINARYNADINFSFSKFSVDMDIQNGSNSKFQIITGYPKTYARSLLEDEALSIRKAMQTAGAKKIIFVLDENSNDDSRWHTGHAMQRDNYLKPLEVLIKNPDIGLIFKPKNARSLKHRIGEDTYSILSEAIQTGRCCLLDGLGLIDYTTSSPPMLAALASDLCIHGHFGTAAFEASLLGKPTLMIDREGMPHHTFYDLFDENVIFKNWDDALEASLSFFSSNSNNSQIGDWSKVIKEIDPFNDSLAAKRLGNHLNQIRKGFDEGLNREHSMIKAAEIYSKEWGSDKVIYSKT